MGTRPRRRLRPTRVAGLAFVLLVILEVLAIRFVAGRIGGGPTFLIIVATSLVGAWVVALEGRRRWQALAEAVRAGRPPEREVADGILVLLGGLLLLLPGLVSDVLGLLLVLPPTRALARLLLVPMLGRHVLLNVSGPPGGSRGFGATRSPRAGGEVIEGHVIHDDAVEGEVLEGDIIEPDPGPDEGDRS